MPVGADCRSYLPGNLRNLGNQGNARPMLPQVLTGGDAAGEGAWTSSADCRSGEAAGAGPGAVGESDGATVAGDGAAQRKKQKYKK